MKRLRPILVLMVVAAGNAQGPAPTSNTSQFANHHVLLVPASTPGTQEAQWIAVGPDGSLSIFPGSTVIEKMNAGYRPYTFGEMIDAIGALAQQNAALGERVRYLEQRQSPTQEQRAAFTVTVDPQTLQAQAEMQRRSQQRQAALMLLMGMRTTPPQTINLNYSNCNKNPALCAH